MIRNPELQHRHFFPFRVIPVKQVEIGLVPFGAIGLTLFGLDLFLASPASPGVNVGALEFLSQGANWRICADLLLIGVFGGFYIVPLYALVQHRPSPSHLSRVIAGLNILNALFMVFAAVMAMLVRERPRIW